MMMLQPHAPTPDNTTLSGRPAFFATTYPKFVCSLLLKMGSIDSKAFNKSFNILCENDDVLSDFLLTVTSPRILRELLKKSSLFRNSETPQQVGTHLKEAFLDCLKDATGSKISIAQKITSILQEADSTTRPIEKRIHELTKHSSLIFLPPDITPEQLALNNFGTSVKISLNGFFDSERNFTEEPKMLGTSFQKFINSLIPSPPASPMVARIDFTETEVELILQKYKKFTDEEVGLGSQSAQG